MEGQREEGEERRLAGRRRTLSPLVDRVVCGRVTEGGTLLSFVFATPTPYPATPRGKTRPTHHHPVPYTTAMPREGYTETHTQSNTHTRTLSSGTDIFKGNVSMDTCVGQKDAASHPFHLRLYRPSLPLPPIRKAKRLHVPKTKARM